MHILALCGSLRTSSLNMALLEAAKSLVPRDHDFVIFRGIGGLPPFTPDLDSALPADVIAFRRQAASADVLVMACPEYAGGIPGMFKNALDWLVGCEDFNSRPVVLLNCSPRAVEAENALRLVLRTMSAPVIETASRRIPVRDRQATAKSLVADPEIRAALQDVFASLETGLAALAE